MANQEQLALLKQGVQQWNEWREQNPDVKVDLKEARLLGLSLNGANLQKADLSKTHIEDTDLESANLKGANLRDAALWYVDLRNALLGTARLMNADLLETNLFLASLRSANLKNASLWRVDLRHADLTKAKLNEADLGEAVLGGTILDEADLSDARCGATVMVNCRLSRTKGLDTCIHTEPSMIDHYTLEQAPGIAIEFLRGCGLPDWQILAYKLCQLDLTVDEIEDISREIVRLRAADSRRRFPTFISYSQDDKAFAVRLHDALQARGVRCWLDEHELEPGGDMYEEVDSATSPWDKTLLCASRSALTSWWVDNEIEGAIAQEHQMKKGRRRKKTLALIPLDLDGYMFSDEWMSENAGEVRSRVAADFAGWEEGNDIFEEQVEQVVKALHPEDDGAGKPAARRKSRASRVKEDSATLSEGPAP